MTPRPLEVEHLLTADQRRPRRVTVEEHHQFRQSLATPPPADPIDEAVAVPDPPQKRSDKETFRVLAILDELERGDK